MKVKTKSNDIYYFYLALDKNKELIGYYFYSSDIVKMFGMYSLSNHRKIES